MSAGKSLLAVDPGYANPGNAMALFLLGQLVDVWFEARTSGVYLAGKPDHIVIEMPQADERSEHIPASSLIKLSWAGGFALGRYKGVGTKVTELTPNRWKGSTPKPQHHQKLWNCLSHSELAVLGGDETSKHIEAACEAGALSRWSRPGASYYGGWKGHNLLDAVALGAFFLKRIGK